MAFLIALRNFVVAFAWMRAAVNLKVPAMIMPISGRRSVGGICSISSLCLRNERNCF